MFASERPVFGTSFELWREDGILCLALAPGAMLRVQEMKELLRLVATLDASASAPVLIDCAEQVQVDLEARHLMRRSCVQAPRPVALLTTDLDMRLQGEVFRRMEKPSYPFRIFGRREDAWRWLRERQQLKHINALVDRV